MNKKFLGVKLSTYMTFVICLLVAFAMWLIFNLPNEITSAAVLPIVYRV